MNACIYAQKLRRKMQAFLFSHLCSSVHKGHSSVHKNIYLGYKNANLLIQLSLQSNIINIID